jgi:hypothetical protein
MLDCSHQCLCTYFQPATGLTTYNSLDSSDEPVEVGWRSKASQRELSWTVLDLEHSPPFDCCCSRCTPDVLSRYPASDRHDARLKVFASDFLFPIPAFSRRRRMDSISSTEILVARLATIPQLDPHSFPLHTKSSSQRNSGTTW